MGDRPPGHDYDFFSLFLIKYFKISGLVSNQNISVEIFLGLSIFLLKKMNEFRKTITQSEIMERLRNGQISLGPLTLRLLETEPRLGNERRLDALIEVSWQDAKAKFAVECKSLSTPKAFQDATSLLKTTSLPEDCWPMIIMPLLSEDQLQQLEREGISGIDLSGNGVVMVSKRLAVYKTGRKNKFPTYAPIKNVYQKTLPWWGESCLLDSPLRPFRKSELKSTEGTFL